MFFLLKNLRERSYLKIIGVARVVAQGARAGTYLGGALGYGPPSPLGRQDCKIA